MAKHNDIKIDLKPFDDLFETDESRADLQKERLSDIPIKDIHDFPDHPYQVKDDEAMMELVESIKAYGLLHPVVVRTLEDGSFEMNGMVPGSFTVRFRLKDNMDAARDGDCTFRKEGGEMQMTGIALSEGE